MQICSWGLLGKGLKLNALLVGHGLQNEPLEWFWRTATQNTHKMGFLRRNVTVIPSCLLQKQSRTREHFFLWVVEPVGWHGPLPSLPLLFPHFPLEAGPFNPARRRSGERCKLPRRGAGLGQSPSRNRIWCIFGFKIWHLVAEMLVIFLRINLRKSLWYWSEKILILYSFWGLSDTPSQPFIILRVSTYTPDTRWNSPIFHAWLYDVECW